MKRLIGVGEIGEGRAGLKKPGVAGIRCVVVEGEIGRFIHFCKNVFFFETDQRPLCGLLRPSLQVRERPVQRTVHQTVVVQVDKSSLSSTVVEIVKCMSHMPISAVSGFLDDHPWCGAV